MIRRFGLAVAVVVVLIVLFGTGAWFFFRVTLPPPYSGPAAKIIIGNIGEHSIFNIIAKEKGYFAAHGLDAEVQEYDAGPAAIAALQAGTADVVLAAEFVGVSHIFKDKNVRILTEVSRHEVFHVIARVSNGIQKPADLKGKRIGVTRKSAGEFYLGRFLTFNNLSLNDVSVVDLRPEGLMNQLRAGEVDAIVIFDPHAYRLQKELGDAVIAWSAQNGQKTFALAYSTASFIEAHKEVVERYLRSVVQAEEYTREHPSEAQSLIAEALGYDPEYVRYMWQNFDFGHALDPELLLSMEDQARWLIENKLTDSNAVPNYLDSIYFDALQKVKPEAVRIIR